MAQSTTLDSARLLAGLDPRRDWQLELVAGTGSTNHDLAEQAKAGKPSWSVLIADYQSGGRGRFERSWVAPAGTALACSLLVRPKREMAAWGWLPLLIGLGVYQALAELSGDDRIQLKWPNDVLIGGLKICGILTEAVSTPSGLGVICGWGLNISIPAERLPVPTATSLELAGIVLDRNVLMAAILNHISELIWRWEAGESMAEHYVSRCASIGKQLRVQLDQELGLGEVCEGMGCGIGASGELLVLSGEQVLSFNAGDVKHLR